MGSALRLEHIYRYQQQNENRHKDINQLFRFTRLFNLFWCFVHSLLSLFSMRHWLVKQEPETYPWSRLLEDKKTIWDGIRNYQARNFMREMSKGDLVFFYNSGRAKELVGLAKVAKSAYSDPTATEGDWAAFDLRAMKSLKQPVTLQQIKADPSFQELHLVRNSRLSVMPIGEKEFKHLLDLAQTTA